jgi:hypothetical protein
MRVSGQRAFPRFRVFGAWLGRLRALRQVVVNLTGPGDVLNVISEGPAVVGDELTLALVEGSEHVDLKVRVVGTSPHVIDGVVRHQLTLEVLGTQVASTDTRGWQR